MAYNLQDLDAAVQDDLHDTSFSTSRITRYLNYGQQLIFNTHMFRFCEKTISGPLTINKYTYDQQSDHQSTIGGIVYDPNNTATQFILDDDSYLAPDDFFKEYPLPSTQAVGLPGFWTEFGDQVYFNRPADATYTFLQRYYRYPTDMSATTDVPLVPLPFRELLELYATARGEKYRGNHDIGATYMQQFEDGLENMVLRYAQRTQVGPTIMRSSRTRTNASV
jgi:hypothetical protein